MRYFEDLSWDLTSGSLHGLVNRLEASLLNELQDLRADLGDVSRASDEQRREHIEQVACEEIPEVENCQQWTRRALVLLIYGAFEAGAKELLQRLDRRPGRCYLADVECRLSKLGVPRGAFGEAWQFVRGASSARNAIAHELGEARPALGSKAMEHFTTLKAFCDRTAGIQLRPLVWGVDDQSVRTATDDSSCSVHIEHVFVTTLLDNADQAIMSLATAIRVLQPPPQPE